MDKSQFLAKYGTEHIVVYAGYDVQFRSQPSAIPAGKTLAGIDSSRVYIDDMNYGAIKRPFSCFDVGPGLHKLEVLVNLGDGVVSADAHPARVKDTSLYVSVRAVKCLSGTYFEIKDFTDFDEFLQYTGAFLSMFND